MAVVGEQGAAGILIEMLLIGAQITCRALNPASLSANAQDRGGGGVRNLQCWQYYSHATPRSQWVSFGAQENWYRCSLPLEWGGVCNVGDRLHFTG